MYFSQGFNFLIVKFHLHFLPRTCNLLCFDLVNKPIFCIFQFTFGTYMYHLYQYRLIVCEHFLHLFLSAYESYILNKVFNTVNSSDFFILYLSHFNFRILFFICVIPPSIFLLFFRVVYRRYFCWMYDCSLYIFLTLLFIDIIHVFSMK